MCFICETTPTGCPRSSPRVLYLSIPKTCGAFLEGGIHSAAPSAMLWFVLAASLGAPAEQLMPQGDGANAADVAAASGVAAGVDAAHPSGVGNCISVSASVPDFWCGQQTSPPANLCKCGDDRLAAEAEAKAKAKSGAARASAVKTPDRGAAEVQRREAEGIVDVVGATAVQTSDRASADVIAAANTSGVSSCVSVSASVPDFYCVNTCKNAAACPSELCKCGDADETAAALAAAAVKTALKAPKWRSDRNWGHGSKVACTSIDPSVNDFWCTTACASNENGGGSVVGISDGRCNANLCRCAEFTAEELQARDEEEELVCDFDATACVGGERGCIDAACTSGDLDDRKSLKGVEKLEKCRTCDRHITICMSSRGHKQATKTRSTLVDECLDEVAGLVECGGCNTAESKLAYKVRLGLEAPSQGVDKRVRQRAANTAKVQQGGGPLVDSVGQAGV